MAEGGWSIEGVNWEGVQEGISLIVKALISYPGYQDVQVFILYYMEGCGPCNETRPEWEKLKNSLKKYDNDNTIAIVEIDQDLASKVKDAKKEPNSFPTIRFITNKGEDVESYEDSNVEIIIKLNE